MVSLSAGNREFVIIIIIKKSSGSEESACLVTSKKMEGSGVVIRNCFSNNCKLLALDLFIFNNIQVQIQDMRSYELKKGSSIANFLYDAKTIVKNTLMRIVY